MGPPALGEEWVIPGIWVGSLQTLPLLKDHPSPSHLPLQRLGSSGALGTLREEGPGAGCIDSKAGLRSPPPAAGAAMRTCCPTADFSLPPSSVQGREQAHDSCRQSGLYATEGFCAHQPHGHFALCSGLLCWDASTRRAGYSLRPPPPLLPREGPMFLWAAGRRGPLKLPGQGPSVLMDFPTFVLPQD